MKVNVPATYLLRLLEILKSQLGPAFKAPERAIVKCLFANLLVNSTPEEVFRAIYSAFGTNKDYVESHIRKIRNAIYEKNNENN